MTDSAPTTDDVSPAGDNAPAPAIPSTGQEWVHFVATLTVPLPGVNPLAAVFTYGTELRVTPELREAGVDRTGVSWLDFLHDEPGQAVRWGEVCFRPGPWPTDVPRVKPGSPEWLDERDSRRREAYSNVADDRERAALLAKIDSYYGRPVTSTTVKSFRYPERASSALEEL